MEKRIFDEQNGLWYELHGDYYLPCLSISETEAFPLGRYARAHWRYLQQRQPAVLAEMSAKGTLNSYLHSIDTQAEEVLSLLITQLAERDGINESLKAADQMAWVKSMETIRNQAEEVIMADIVYA